MKKLHLFTFISFLLIPFYSLAANSSDFQVDAPKEIINNYISDIKTLSSPRIVDDYIIFTAAKESRFTGIAFDFENFTIIHPFYRSELHDDEGVFNNSILFYIAMIPPDIDKISYRLIIDGLWTIDPINPNRYFNPVMQVELSTITIPYKDDNYTKTTKPDKVHFVYRGTTGQKIRLGGSFTNWDSWIYQMNEVAPGVYELDIPLPAGTWYYNFYSGSLAMIDKNNPNRAYTTDGRTASVITVN